MSTGWDKYNQKVNCFIWTRPEETRQDKSFYPSIPVNHLSTFQRSISWLEASVEAGLKLEHLVLNFVKVPFFSGLKKKKKVSKLTQLKSEQQSNSINVSSACLTLIFSGGIQRFKSTDNTHPLDLCGFPHKRDTHRSLPAGNLQYNKVTCTGRRGLAELHDTGAFVRQAQAHIQNFF